jgi:tetratricopeptide (TPR) repeat protein
LEVPLDMPSPFLSSEEYDERAHQLYNEGQYEEALEVLREGLALYPHSVELHIGVGYARLAREEYAWARKSFEEALVLDPEHEDALAGLGETLMKFGQQEAGVKTFRRILELGYRDDIDLMLQAGRALFRESLFEEAREFFEIAVQQAPEMAEGVALLGYTQHRLGEEDSSVSMLRRALQIDDDHAEARIYLANILYDRGDYEAALYHLDRTTPEDHWDELGIWRLVELKKSIYRLQDDDPELRPWDERLAELAGEPDDVDEILAEIEGRFNDQRSGDDQQSQLELFGALLSEFAEQRDPAEPRHRILTREGREYVGSWEQIVREMRDANKQWAGRTVQEFMHNEARRGYSLTGITIPTHNAESFIRGSADAGLLRIVR